MVNLKKTTMLKAVHSRIWSLLLCAGLIIGLLTACDDSGSPTTPATPPLAKELVLYNWVDYMPQSVLDAFEKEYGIKVNYVVYESQEGAVEDIRAGKLYDVVVMAPEQIPRLIREGKLAAIDFRNVPNFKYVSANFRDLTFDPGNRYSIPFHWGTTGLLVRADLVKRPLTRWSDLWDSDFAGKIALWPIPRSLIPIALKTLGYSVNTANPAELEAALQHLLKLKPNAFIVGNENATVIPVLAEGQAAISYGWAFDALTAQKQGLTTIQYVVPEEGTILWGDHFVIPANSPRRREAELFLDFVLRPEIAGQIVNESYYAMPHDAAHPFILPEILNNPLIYPPNEQLQKAELTLPLSAEGDALYDAIWQRFLADGK